MGGRSKLGNDPGQKKTLAESVSERDERFGEAVKKRFEDVKKRRKTNETLKKEKSD